MRHVRNAYSILVGKPDVRRPLRRPRRRGENNNRTDLRENLSGYIWLRAETGGELL
jgi:hypothetical protein